MMVYEMEKNKIANGNNTYFERSLVSCSMRALRNIYGFLGSIMGDLDNTKTEVSFNEEENRIELMIGDSMKFIDFQELVGEIKSEAQKDKHYDMVLDMVLGNEDIALYNYLGCHKQKGRKQTDTSVLEDILIKMLFSN